MGARVFVSCGQAKGSDEIEIARQIRERLTEEGYEPYIAVEEQTLVALTDNIFTRLRNSEYFVFIDFKRERLEGKADHWGSLFSHQELAIAAFLNVNAVVAFQEVGVKTDDGMLGPLQLNADQFTDRHNLLHVVADTIRQRHWSPNWRNELVLERTPTEFSSAQVDYNGQQLIARFFHISVHNRHREKLATNCSVYLEKAIRLPATNIPLKTVEFKWAGVQIPSVGIAPAGTREFDAFLILHQDPSQVRFNTFSDSIDYIPVFPTGPAEYELSYAVRSENFSPARGVFKLHLNAQLANTIFS